MKLFKSSILLLCLLSMSLSSCDKEESDDSVDPDPVILEPQLTATIDGVPFEASRSLIGGSLTFLNEMHQLGISASNQFGNGQVTVQVYFIDFDIDNFVNDAEFDGGNTVGLNYFLGKVDRVDMEDGEGSSFTTQDAYGVITSINTSRKVISGNFSFTTYNEDETESVVTEGFFENISYN